MTEDKVNEEAIRKRITKRYDNRSEFFGHLIAFVVVNGLLWGALQPQNFWYTLSLIFSGLWGMGLAIHFVMFLTNEAKERAIEKAIERERGLRSDQQQERISRLSDDGEIEIVYEDDAPPAKKRKRG